MAEARIRILDGMRGGAAASVALYHFIEVHPRGLSLYDTASRWGWLGVPVFFVLSGYCVQRAAEREHAPRDFLLRRFARIYPGYVFSLAVVVVFCVIRKLTTGINDFIALPTSVAAWIATLSLTTAPVTTVPTINWVNWSLSFEIFFYLVLAVGLRSSGLRRVWLPVLSVAALFPTVTQYVFFLRGWGMFALGVALALPRREAIGLTLLAVAATLRESSPPEIIVALASAGLIAGSKQVERFGGRWLDWLAQLGKISYSLYLLHVPVGVWLVGRFVDAHHWRARGLAAHLACDGAALAASVLAASLTYRYVEQPGIAWGRRQTAPKAIGP